MRNSTIERKVMVVEKITKVYEEEGISNVSIKRISELTGVPTASLNRYFGTIGGVISACIADANRKVFLRTRKVYEEIGGDKFTALQEVEFFLDTFIDLYQHHKGFLRFSMEFSLYVQYHQIPDGSLAEYTATQKQYSDMFANGYNKRINDGTIRSDLTLEIVFYTCFHCMLATVQKFAVGISPITKKDSLKELQMLKQMLLDFLKNK